MIIIEVSAVNLFFINNFMQKYLLLILVVLIFAASGFAVPVTVAPVTVPNRQGGEGTAQLRVYANKSFYASDGSFVPGSRVDSADVYVKVDCTVAQTSVICPAIILQSTTDAADVTTATYFAAIYDGRGVRRIVLGNNTALAPTLAPTTTWTQITKSNSFSGAPLIQTQTEFYNKSQVDAIIGAALADVNTLIAGTDKPLSFYSNSLSAAIKSIGAAKKKIIVSEDAVINAPVTIPANITLEFQGDAVITKTGTGTLTLAGTGIVNATERKARFAGFAPGDVIFAGDDYPKQITTELFDTGNNSLNERLNIINEAAGDRQIEIHAYPRNIGSQYTLFNPNTHVIFHAGIYTNSYDLPLLNKESAPDMADKAYVEFHPFTFQSNTVFEFEKGAVMYNSPVTNQGGLFAPQYIHAQYENVEFINPYFVDGGGLNTDAKASLIDSGNTKNFKVTNLRSINSKYYVVSIVGGGNIDPSYLPEDVTIDGFYVKNCFTQAINPIRGKNIRIRNGVFVYDYTGTANTSGIGVDAEPNAEPDNLFGLKISDISFYYIFNDQNHYPVSIAVQGVAKRVTEVDISDIRIFGKNNGNLGGIKHFIQAYGVDGLRIKNNVFEGSYDAALDISVSDRVEVDGNVFNDIESLSRIEAVSNSNLDFTSSNKVLNPKITETERYFPVLANGTTFVTAFPQGINDDLILTRIYSHFEGQTVNFNGGNATLSNIIIRDDLLNYERKATSSSDYGTRPDVTFAAADISGNTVNKTAHGLLTGTPVLRSSSGTFPAIGTNKEKIYIIRNSADSFSFASTLKNALDGTVSPISNAGTGTQTLKQFNITQYSLAATSVSTATDEIIFPAAHNYADKSYIRFETYGGAAIGGLINGLVYIVKAVGADKIKLAKTEADFNAGNFIDLTNRDDGAIYIFTPVLQTRFSSNNYKVAQQLSVNLAKNSQSKVVKPISGAEYQGMKNIAKSLQLQIFDLNPPILIHAIDCGRESDKPGAGIWEQDIYSTGGSAGYLGNSTLNFNGYGIAEQAARYVRFAGNSSFEYNIPDAVPNSSVLVELFFMVQDVAVNKFNVDIQGERVVAGYDVFTNVGTYKVDKIRALTTADASGNVKIVFSSIRQVTVSGIKTFRSSTK